MVGDENCDTFAPNPFKLAILLQKENCKNCGRPWTDHQDVISEDQVGGYLKAIKSAADDWRKIQQAKDAGDRESWLPEEFRDALSATEVPDSETDGSDVEFQMFTPTNFSEATVEHDQQAADKMLKVVNLIDFGECNEIQDCQTPPPELRDGATTCDDEIGNECADHDAMHSKQSSHEHLQEQIHNLKQMLLDTVQEKAVQISILHDDLHEKDRLIADLRRRHSDSESSLCEMRDQIWSLQKQLAQAELASGGQDARGSRITIKQMGDLCLYMRDRFVKEILDCPFMEKTPGTGGSDMSSEGTDLARDLQRLCDAASAAGEVVRNVSAGTVAAAVCSEMGGVDDEPQGEQYAEQASHDEADLQSPELGISAGRQTEHQVRLDKNGEHVHARYLPKFINGVPVLVMEAPNVYRVDNGRLRARSAGLGYRLSRCMGDKDASSTAKWGSLVRGTDAGDGWIRCQIQDWTSVDNFRKFTDRSNSDDWLDFGDLHHEARQVDFHRHRCQRERPQILKNFGTFWNYLKDLDDR
eukprot:TRINITY_DN5736_c0_g1_i1.p1 TRINITY_DN5736_c0_g1~~TRINITY_DN5736_c0_g1_i1.p1  ORF type:complete len:527 (-),score=107.04 TRINITY_DN5736_c0_g1_i1:126-1706(-)